VPAKSLKELAEYVSASPGKFNYGSPGSGSPAHLTGAAFSQQTGNSMVYVPYKGTPPMVQALLAGDIQVAFPTLTGIIGPVKAGKLRVLAVMARARIAELPDVPTTVEAGFPQLIGGNWWVLAAPRGTNSRIIERLAAEFRTALAEPGVRKRVSDFGHVAIGLAPAETAGFLKSESARYKSSSNWAASNRSECDSRKRARREARPARRSDGGGKDRHSSSSPGIHGEATICVSRPTSPRSKGTLLRS